MIIFVERNKVDISEFIGGLKKSISFLENNLRARLDFANDKIKVIEEMHRIMCEQKKIIDGLRKKIDSEKISDCKDEEGEFKPEFVIKNLKLRNRILNDNYSSAIKNNEELSHQVKELSRLNSEKEDEILDLEKEKKKLYDELQKEKAINRRLRNTIKNIVKGDEIGKKYSNPTFVEGAYIPSDAIIPKEVIAGIIFERPTFL